MRNLPSDLPALLVLLIATLVFAAVFVDFSVSPFEDAAILMRYAGHLAGGHGIVWNVGEAPVDGATDFLFMAVVALLVKLGVALEIATRGIGFASHLLTVGVVYATARRHFRLPALPVSIACSYLALGPGLFYVSAYFGTPFFALFASLSWCVALHIVQRGESASSALGFALFALVTALIRPEGVILSALMLGTILFLNGWRGSRRTTISYLAVFLIVGGAYFLWRWHYFGFPLPNAFYKKGGAHIQVGSLQSSVLMTIKLCMPLLPVFALGLLSTRTRRLVLAFSIPLVGFAAAFAVLSDEMNYGARFQYALLPIALMSCWPLVAGLGDAVAPRFGGLLPGQRLVLALATVAMWAVVYLHATMRLGYHRDGRYDVAVALSDYADRGLRVATSESGLLPLYSRWTALDTWGLSDSWIAHHGAITEEYLGRFGPHLIVFHEFFSPLVPPREPRDARGREWFEMAMVLKAYAEKNGYTPAAAYGDSPYDAHLYYVRSDFPESDEIVRRIRETEYTWYRTGRKAINYLGVP
ncbi:MAG: hypothetical protein L0Z51_08645 [Candidatus Latescibacteria bacterium]|nr:hypothetical protein [Candidatus Latescibacterota bacterium]